jgi:hypothetical protein
MPMAVFTCLVCFQDSHAFDITVGGEHLQPCDFQLTVIRVTSFTLLLDIAAFALSLNAFTSASLPHCLLPSSTHIHKHSPAHTDNITDNIKHNITITYHG